MFLRLNRPSRTSIQVAIINAGTLLISLLLLILSLNLQYANNEAKLAREKLSLIWTKLLNEDIVNSLNSLRQLYYRDLYITNSAYGIRIADNFNNTLLLEYPTEWNKYFKTNLDFENTTKNISKSYRLKSQIDNKKSKSNLVVYSLLLNKFNLQVIISLEPRFQFLSTVLENGISIILAIMSISFIITNIVITRVLRPLNAINKIVEEIIAHQSIKKRLSEKGMGEFIRIQKNFNTMLEVIERQVNRLRQAAINVGHDIRTPITRIKNQLEYIHTKIINKQHRSRIEGCLDAIDDLSLFTKRVLDLSEIESGLVKIPDRAINILESLEEIIEIYEILAEDKSVILNKNIDAHATILMDKVRLQQIVGNLLDNAIKFTPANKNVTLNIRKDTSIIIEVIDEGYGISEQDKAFIFMPTWSKNRENEKIHYSSTGFGLSIVESIVQAYRGRIKLETEVGKGSKFIVEM